MRLRFSWSSIASAALVASACATPKGAGLFDPAAGGAPTGSGAQAGDAGGSNDEDAGAAATEAGAGNGGTGAVGGGSMTSPGLNGGGASGSNGGGGASAGGGATAGGPSSAGGNGGGSAGGGMLSKCELMLLQANALLQGAQACNTSSGKAFCTGYASNECGCKVPVDAAESAESEKYAKSRDMFRGECPVSCATPCSEPTGQRCELYPGLTVGVCVPTAAAP